MIITDIVNNLAVEMNGLADAATGFTTAGLKLAAGAAVWCLFWTKVAKAIPTEWQNRYARFVFRTLNCICRILGLDIPNIAKIQFSPFRIITREEMTANKVVAAAVIPMAVEEHPRPPADLQTIKDQQNA